MQPSLGVDGAGRRLGVVEVLLHVHVAPAADLADGLDGFDLPARIEDRHLRLRQRVTDGLLVVGGVTLGPGLCQHGRCLRLPVDDREGDAELLTGPPDELGRYGGSSRHDGLHAGQIAVGERWVLEHGDEHGRHGQRAGAALLLEHVEHQPGIEVGQQHLGAAQLRHAQGRHHAAAGVEHRHAVHPHVVGTQLHDLGRQTGVVGDAPMGEQGAFGKAGRARRVLDLGGVVGRHGLEGDCRVAGVEEAVPRREVDHLPQLRDVRSDFFECGGHGVAPELGDKEQTQRL